MRRVCGDMSEQEEIYRAIQNATGKTYTEKEMRDKLGLEKRMVLKKDIIIPAGTVFTQAATKVERSIDHVEATIGLTYDVAVNFVIPTDEDLKEYF